MRAVIQHLDISCIHVKAPDDPILSWRGTLRSVESHINYYHEFRNIPSLSFLFHSEDHCLFLQQSGRNLTRYDRRGEETLETGERYLIKE